MVDEERVRGPDRGSGRGNGRGRGGQGFGRGFGRGTNPPNSGKDDFTKELSKVSEQSWRWNSVRTTESVATELMEDANVTGKDVVVAEVAPSARKRLAMDSNINVFQKEQDTNEMVLYENHTFVAIDREELESDQGKIVDETATPQKNANKKKQKGVEGGVILNTKKSNSESGSAAPRVGDRREQ